MTIFIAILIAYAILHHQTYKHHRRRGRGFGIALTGPLFFGFRWYKRWKV
jgi:hypothetical protein